ncbi:nuclear transport factor 2 family protein [Mycobacterium sp. E2479]|uniref:nuclear transport factor 2 family protein n=1 Tax=Mycobacterium sp. E2479 TaxID=1834134 RepID=UPI0007FD5958|nr:nuclear transport factor 2 family protein [Mycobacterium sp. E2479]OBH50447.1 DUF4440 domain-containing protein [Mycobacterium sp. E2479]
MDDIEAIKRLKARYCRLMDTKDWNGYRELFTDDVTVDLELAGEAVPGQGQDSTEAAGAVIAGADSFLAMLVPTLGEVVTVHQCHTPEIDVLSPSTARGIWAMEDLLRFPDGTELHGFGHYHETYEKQGEDWLIKSTRLTRLRTDVVAGPQVARRQIAE